MKISSISKSVTVRQIFKTQPSFTTHSFSYEIWAKLGRQNGLACKTVGEREGGMGNMKYEYERRVVKDK